LTKAIALLSGGLDSTLAVKLILDQGIEVEAVNFISAFCTCTSSNSGCLEGKKAAVKLGIKLKVVNISREILELVKHPKYGYGRNMNPCLDCRIFTLKKAGEYMREQGASFLITGEVLGERPMSQRRDAMRIIERDSGFNGLILRPLSAKLLPPTIPENEGWVDREKLLDIQGRSRKPQIALAEELGISDYPCPAGGCLLTDPGFAKRMRDLMDHNPNFTLNDVHLLKVGRHFRLSPKAKTIVGRNEKENKKVLSFAQKGDFIYKVLDFPGPLTIVRGKLEDYLSELPACITAGYSKAKNEKEITVSYKECPSGRTGVFQVSPLERNRLEELMI
jgi:tRNA U34 2-thiouridine synthase MnmA/TrmU